MTDLDPDTAPTFRDLMASVGYFIFYWGQLEVALDSEIARMQKTLEERVDGLNAVDMTRRIAEWRRLIRLSESDTNLHLASDQVGSEIAELRIHRNVIAHGLRGGDGGSWSNEGHIVCAERVENSAPNSTRTYSKSDLDRLVQSTDRCRRAIRSLRIWMPGE